MRIEFRVEDLSEARRLVRQAPLHLQRHATVLALNKVADTVKSAVVREAAAAFAVPQRVLRGSKDSKGYIHVLKARRSQRVPNFAVVGLTGGIKLIRLGGERQGKRGAAVKGKRIIPGTFIATMASGHTGIFRRKGKARLPIQEIVISTGHRLERIIRRTSRSLFRTRFPVEFPRAVRQARSRFK